MLPHRLPVDGTLWRQQVGAQALRLVLELSAETQRRGHVSEALARRSLDPLLCRAMILLPDRGRLVRQTGRDILQFHEACVFNAHIHALLYLPNTSGDARDPSVRRRMLPHRLPVGDTLRRQQVGAQALRLVLELSAEAHRGGHVVRRRPTKDGPQAQHLCEIGSGIGSGLLLWRVFEARLGADVQGTPAHMEAQFDAPPKIEQV